MSINNYYKLQNEVNFVNKLYNEIDLISSIWSVKRHLWPTSHRSSIETYRSTPDDPRILSQEGCRRSFTTGLQIHIWYNRLRVWQACGATISGCGWGSMTGWFSNRKFRYRLLFCSLIFLSQNAYHKTVKLNTDQWAAKNWRLIWPRKLKSNFS